MEEEQPDLPYLFNAEFTVGGERVQLRVRFSSRMVRASEMVPLLQTVTDKIVAIGVDELAGKGEGISCRKGCSACCSQLVPISEPEARYLLQLVETFPEERRVHIRSRYDDIKSRLDDSNLLEQIWKLGSGTDREARRRVGIDYFKLGLPCPFLEEDSCSIHEHRPLSCREFLVVSSPEYCALNDPEHVVVVDYPRRTSVVLYRFGDGKGDDDARLLPLSLMFDWAANHTADEEPQFAAAEYCENFLKRLAQP